MILNGSEDLRVKKTITAIHKAFIELIEKKEYTKITVKELCEKALINKKTFYSYYLCLDELLKEMQEILLNEFLEKINNYKLPDDLAKVNKEFFLYSISKGKVYERIMCCESYSFLGKQISQKFVTFAWKNFSDNCSLDKYRQNILYCFLQHTGLELYRQWVYDKKQIPVEEIIDMSGGLLCNGINGFLSVPDNLTHKSYQI